MRFAEERYIPKTHRPWTHQGHIAYEYVPELRQFIDRCLTQDSSQGSNPRIVLNLENGPRGFVQVLQTVEQSLGLPDHGAEFNEAHLPSAVAVALLDKKHRPRTRQLDGTCNQQQERH